MGKLLPKLELVSRWTGSSSLFTVYLTVLAFNEKIHCAYFSVYKRYKDFVCFECEEESPIFFNTKHNY